MKVLTLTLAASVFAISSSANGALLERLGGLAYYDDEANLTWLADANYAATQYANSGGTEGAAYGVMNWQAANDWAAGLTVGGVTGWRLPDVNPVNGIEFNPTSSFNGTTDYGYNIGAPGTAYAGTKASEFAYLFYNVLGNVGYCDPILSTASTCSGVSGAVLNKGPFSNYQGGQYWTSTDRPGTSFAWLYNVSGGGQYPYAGKLANASAWAVKSGDVSAVPVPAAVWLFGSGLISLAGLARRKR